MRKRMFVALLPAVLLGLGRWYAEAGPSAPDVSGTALAEPPEAGLNRLANDPTASRSARAAAVFGLFKHHLKPGDRLPQVRRVLRDTAWLKEAKLYYFCILGGWIPVDRDGEDRTYSLHLFADIQGHSEWVIYFQLEGQSEGGKWNEDGIAFLRGKAGSKGESRIKQFALCYPGGKDEVFNGRQAR